jgi:hypothetical protein
MPLPEGVACYTIAANIGTRTTDVFGDGMVPANSALGRHEDPKLALSFPLSRQWVGYGMNHLDLLSHRLSIQTDQVLARVSTSTCNSPTEKSLA